MKISEHFFAEELVPEYIYKRFGQSSTWFINPRLVHALEWLRTKSGWRLKINDWHTGGKFQNRGYRLPDTKVGGSLSQHKLGNAADFSSPDATPKELYDFILAHEADAIKAGFTTLEDFGSTGTWVHADTRFIASPQTKLLIVKP